MLREGPVAEKKKVEINKTHKYKEYNRLIDSIRVETQRLIGVEVLNCNCFVPLFCVTVLEEMGS